MEPSGAKKEASTRPGASTAVEHIAALRRKIASLRKEAVREPGMIAANTSIELASDDLASARDTSKVGENLAVKDLAAADKALDELGNKVRAGTIVDPIGMEAALDAARRHLAVLTRLSGKEFDVVISSVGAEVTSWRKEPVQSISIFPRDAWIS